VSYDYNIDQANKLLDKSGYTDSGSGQRSKANNKKPAFQFKNYLKIGSSGSDVVELQGCLSRLDANFKTLLQNDTNGKYGAGTENAVTAFQKKYLPDVPSTGEVGTGTRKELNTVCFATQGNSIPLQFTLTTINQPQLVALANLLKTYWQKVGVTVQINAVDASDLQDIIKNRDYDALLYGQALGMSHDLYPFWHSTQINDPGLNLSEYQNKNVDQLLKDARETLDNQEKAQDYEKLQDTILTDAPALFLYNPDYLYWASEKVQGVDTTKIVDPAKRFENIVNWYVQTRRVWK
jgi:peptide/nickel transport system substrate-binding protein